MKRRLPGVPAACILSVLAAGAVSAQTTAQGSSSQSTRPAQQSRADAEQQVRAAHQQLLEASRTRDKEAARQLMADDMTWVNVEGAVSSRDEMLEGTPNPPREVNIERVRVFGDTALVTGTAELSSGRQARFLQEWTNRGGEWRLFAHQATAVGEPAQPSAAPPVGTAGRTAMRSSAPLLKSDEERAVWKVQSELYRAYLKGDATAYAKLTSDDYFRIEENGEQKAKTDFLETVKKNASQPAGTIETGDVQVSVTGDTARIVLTNWGTMPSGQPDQPTRVTRIFAKRNGQWQQTAAIFTTIAEK